MLPDLRWRGLIQQTTDDANLANWLDSATRTLYCGFDPTADSLHVGHLMGVMTLRRFQRAGHRPIALVGGATGMIGDPSGKSEERNLLSPEVLWANIAAMEVQMRTILDFESVTNPAILVNNFDWMSRFSYLDFLRDVGKHFPVNVMLAKDSVKGRLERTDSGMSYTEFSYMLLQAYDFVHLADQFQCQLQVGGSDQWGNITAGIDLARRLRGVQLYGITWPLLTKSDGGKMGKTESGAIWLSAARTSPYQFYQYWINVEDADAGKCLRFLTELPREEIETLDTARAANPGARESQRRLAEELTRLIHGDAGLAAARRATEIFFGAEIDQLNDAQLVEIFADVPSKTLPRSRFDGHGLSVIDAFVESGLAKSKGEARRSIEQGGAYVNNRRVEGIDQTLTGKDLASETVMVLRSGRKKYALLRFDG
ncbi:MAG TPA: tyrosine--tRNA ligase [Pirellulales bacterium]|jgi:tyrosyl-tRNA synthetase|nr:tyrosine--tRNA ligase [Pirellulales bacterium]